MFFLTDVERVAALSDVHSNMTALRAVLGELEQEEVDAVVFMGDLTWGPRPSEALAAARSLGIPTYFVSGNAERMLLEMAHGRPPDSPVSEWVLHSHQDNAIAELRGFDAGGVVELRGGLSIRFCHGSPRQDNELLTPITSPERLAEAFAGVEQKIVAHGHTHVQYEREAVGKLIAAPGSVGLPYGVTPGYACWAVFGDEIELRQTAYPLAMAIDDVTASGYPGAARYLQLLTAPPTLAEIQAQAESSLFAD